MSSEKFNLTESLLSDTCKLDISIYIGFTSSFFRLSLFLSISPPSYHLLKWCLIFCLHYIALISGSYFLRQIFKKRISFFIEIVLIIFFIPSRDVNASNSIFFTTLYVSILFSSSSLLLQDNSQN